MDRTVIVYSLISHQSHLGKSRKQGFTLLEVMISLMVITLVVVIFAGAVSVGQKASHMNGEYAQALSLCQHKIDQLRSVGFYRLTYDELRGPEIIDTSPMQLPFRFTEVDQISDYLPEATTSIDIQETDDSDVVLVIVSISWRNGPSATKRSSVSLNALIANVE